jgi:L-lactate dehydrogenase complex protein LldG
MPSARETILGRLRARMRGGDDQRPVPWASRRAFDDLAARFVTTLREGDGEAEQLPTLEAALARLDDLLRAMGAQQIVANDVAPLHTLDLPGRWPAYDWHVVGCTDGDLRAFCGAADVGLGGADAALAETGTVVISSGPGRSRLATLLPPVYIALVPVACLTPDIFTWTAARQGDLPANVTLVSGPSKTADIEQTLAVGVHGPRRFVALLYG